MKEDTWKQEPRHNSWYRIEYYSKTDAMHPSASTFVSMYLPVLLIKLTVLIEIRHRSSASVFEEVVERNIRAQRSAKLKNRGYTPRGVFLHRKLYNTVTANSVCCKRSEPTNRTAIRGLRGVPRVL